MPTQESQPEVQKQYQCRVCKADVISAQGRCPNCGYIGRMDHSAPPQPTYGISGAVPAAPGHELLSSSFLKEAKRYKSKDKGTPSPSQHHPRKTGGDDYKERVFRPTKRSLRTIGASLLVVIVLGGLVTGGIFAARLIGRNPTPGHPLTTSQTYTLTTSVIPAGAGEIKIVSPSSGNGAFEPGSQVTLAALPQECYTFDGGHWEIDGALDWKETASITMNSNRSVTAYFKLIDTTPPVISEVEVPSYSDVSATITWKTDKDATSQVEYGKTKEFGSSTAADDQLATSHRIRLTGLEPHTTYYLMVKSADKCRNESTKTAMLTTHDEILIGEKVGQRAPDFQLPEYKDDNPESPNNGEMVSLSQFKGKKILLNFWNTFCAACLNEFPYIRAVYEDEMWANKNSNSDYVVITVCIDGRADRIGQLEDKYYDTSGPFTFPILLDDVKGNSAAKSYYVQTIPKTVFIDSDGIIREINIGRFSDAEEIEAILKRLD